MHKLISEMELESAKVSRQNQWQCVCHPYRCLIWKPGQLTEVNWAALLPVKHAGQALVL